MSGGGKELLGASRGEIPHHCVGGQPSSITRHRWRDAGGRGDGMPWNNNPGGGGGWKGGGGGPWGSGPQQRGPQPPDLEELLRRSQDRLRGTSRPAAEATCP